MRVRKNSFYYFYPVMMDKCDPPYGVQRGILKEGDRVKVVHLNGCPPPNTMNHAHIMKGTQFAGLVATNSLSKTERKAG
jgi:hypothetical protein